MSMENSVISPATPSAAPSRSQVSKAVIASLLGWSFDLFDLFILLFVAPTVGKLFFPSTSPIFQLAATYASFAVTLLMRPVGSALFGSYADRHGRKKAMYAAVMGVGICTALFGALPTVAQIGGLATVLFILLRLLQGVFVGGVVASTHTIGTETVSPKYRGVMSGLIGGGGAGLGALIASIVFSIVSAAFPGEAFETWGWRVMFFSGILSSILGLFVFKSLEESPLWLQARKNKGEKPQKSPVKAVFSRQYFPILLINLMIVIGGGSAYYLTSGYLPTFLKVINQAPGNVASMVLIVTSIVAIVAPVLVGGLSDLIGRKKTFLLVGVACILALPFLYKGLAGVDDTNAILAYSIALAFLGNAAYAPVLIFLNERFPTEIRSTGTGLSWNMGFAVGGMMPTFVTAASGAIQQIPAMMGYFVIGIFLLYLAGGLIIPETKGNFK